MPSRKEIRDSVLDVTRQTNTQIGTLVNDFINLTLNEINDPAWAIRSGQHHLWSWLRQKTTFSTVASTADYVMKREIDHIALLRQTSTPIKLQQLRDQDFFKYVPNPTDTGNPIYYRMWENEGVAVRLATAQKIDVISSSTADAGSSELAVSIIGYSSGILTSETYTLNGTSTVNGSTTWDAREIFVSKQKATTGTVTVSGNTSATTLLTLGKEERSPKFKVISLYPIPSSVITMYVEYYTRIRELTNDSDAPGFDSKWHYVVRLGALEKTMQYLNKNEDAIILRQQYERAVRAMIAADRTNVDLIEHLSGLRDYFKYSFMRRSETIT